MGPKREEIKPQWKLCTHCRIHVHDKDEKTHQRSCPIPLRRTLPYGYIRDGIFYAKIETKTKLKVDAINHPSPSVIIHPSAMQFLNLHPGGYVVLENSHNQLCLQCWPSETISPSKIFLTQRHALYFDCEHLMKVYSYSSFFEDASLAVEVCLSPKEQKNFMTSTGFKNFVLKKHCRSIIRTGMVLYATFMGYSCELEITQIRGPSIVDQYHNKSIDNDSICEKFKQLNIDNSMDESELDMKTCLDSFHNLSGIQDNNNLRKNNFKCSTPVAGRDDVKNIFSPEPLSKRCRSNRKKQTVMLKKLPYFIMGPQTIIQVKKSENAPTDYNSSSDVTFDCIGGLHSQIKKLKTLLNPFLTSGPEYFNERMVPKGILIYGLPGTGKSLAVKALCNESRVPTVIVKADEVFSKHSGLSALENLRRIFQNAVSQAPCMLFIEEIDKLCSKENGNKPSSERKSIVIELTTLIDELPSAKEKRIVLVVTTSQIDLVEITLRRHGRLEKEIKFDVPTAQDRDEILRTLLASRKHTLTSDEITRIALDAHGFVGRDLERLCSKASFKEGPHSKTYQGIITHENMAHLLKNMKPSIMEEFIVEIPNVSWSNIGGMHHVKQEVKDMVELPLLKPDAFLASGICPSRGIILYGPPGCSKTMIAKAVATESKINFISIKGPQLFNKWVGESEKAVRELFRKARMSAPCIIFFDEIDSIAAQRGSSMSGSNVAERVLTQLLVEIDGVDVMTAGVSIIAATNRPDLIDPVLLRPGRFDRILYVSLPDQLTRREIFEIKLKEMPSSDDVDIGQLVEATEGYTGAEIVAVCHEAALLVISEDVTSVTSVVKMHHFRKALFMVNPRTTLDLIKFYEDYNSCHR